MKKIILLISSICLMIVGNLILDNRDVAEILTYNEEISQESKRYYEYVENEDGTLTTNELAKQDYDISVTVEKMKREENSPYKVLKEGENRYEPPQPPFIILPNIILSGVNYGESTTGSVTVTYEYADIAYYRIGTGSYISFASGTTFSNVGSYVIFCSNNDGNAYAYFTITTISGNDSIVYTESSPHQFYETITTTITTAKSWDYVIVEITCDWDVLINSSYRKNNVLFLALTNSDFKLDDRVGHESILYEYYYFFEHICYTDGTIIETYPASSHQFIELDFANNTNNEYYEINAVDNVAYNTININHPIAANYTEPIDITLRHDRVYVDAVFRLTSYFRLRDNGSVGYNIGNYPTYEFYDNDGHGVLAVNGGNIFGIEPNGVNLFGYLSDFCSFASLIAGFFHPGVAFVISIVGIFCRGMEYLWSYIQQYFTTARLYEIETSVYVIII